MTKYITLEDMMKSFYPQALMDIYLLDGLLQGISLKHVPADKPMDDAVRNTMIKLCQDSKKHCETVGLSLSGMQIERLLKALSKPDCTVSGIKVLANDLSNRLRDEMKSMKFFSIEDKQSLLLDKNLFGEEVTLAFPSAIVDIEEAGKCLAFERFTACIFHLCRVMELGLRLLGDTLKLPPTTNRNWEAILSKCDDELAKPIAGRSLEWQTDGQFFADAAAMLRAVKNAWRNPTMHVFKVYTEEQAEDIWNAVRGFMRRLATKLKE